MAKIIQFFDGAQTISVPTIGNIQASSLSTYANDAAFEAANGPGESGDVYINTTLNVIRYWNDTDSEWQSILSSSSSVDATSIADGTVTNVEFQYINNLTSNAQTQLNDLSSDISQVASGLSTHEVSSTAHSASSIVNVPSGDLVATTVQAALDELQTDVNTRIPSSEKAAANGVATLDGGGKVPAAQLPNSVMELQGFWNASTNTPTLADGVGNPGDIYEVNTAGTANLGSGNITFAIGDWAVYAADNIWHKSINSNAVASVNSLTGNVTLDTDDISEGANLYFTDERAQDAVGTILVDSSTVDFTYTDATPEITASVIDNSITNTKLAQVSTSTFKGRVTAGTGSPEDLTATQATSILNNMIGDSGSGGTKGLVPAPAAGDAAANKFLKADGTWTVAGASGANTTLSNLSSPTAVNQNLLPDSDAGRRLGESGAAWDVVNAYYIMSSDENHSISLDGSVIVDTTAGISINDTSSSGIRLNTNGEVDIKNPAAASATAVRFFDDNNSNYVALKSPGTVTADVTFTLPSADGTNGQVLQTNGSGALSFVTAGSGANTALSNLAAVDLNQNLTTTKASALAINHQTATHDITMSTANNGAGASGKITFTTGTATTTRGDIEFSGRIMKFTGSETNFAVSVTPSAALTYNLGTSSAAWNILYTRFVLGRASDFTVGTDFNTGFAALFQTGHSSGATATGALTVQSGDQLSSGTGTVGAATFRSGNTASGNSNATGAVTLASGLSAGTGATGTLSITSGAITNTGNTANTGAVTVTTGTTNATSGTPTTGALNLNTGTPTGTNCSSGVIALSTGTPTGTGTRGAITAAAASLDMSSVSTMTLVVPKTVTGGGTTGAQTINKISGTVNFAAAATSLVVTNSTVTANSIVMATVRTNDTTMFSVQAVPAAGSFTLYANAAATAETSVGFLVIN